MTVKKEEVKMHAQVEDQDWLRNLARQIEEQKDQRHKVE